jgi:hypothetical protein
MGAPGVDSEPIRHFLQFLSDRTRDLWRHRFLTTNWDFLLQHEIDNFVPDVPDWLFPTTHVFHLNGTIEVRADNSRRSAIVLRDDKKRTPSQELNEALSQILWGRILVVVGMSFECRADRALFHVLNKVKEMLPIGESEWIIVNPCQAALDTSRDLIKCNLPGTGVTPVPNTLTSWQEAEFLELREKGVFS